MLASISRSNFLESSLRGGQVLFRVVSTFAAVFFLMISSHISFAEEPIRVNSNAVPELAPGTWFNTPKGLPLKLSAFKGKVTILHFWTLGCINCRRNLPAYNRWRKKFEGKEVEIVGIHTPETPGEASKAAVSKAIKKHGIVYPVLVDSLVQGRYSNWDRWDQHFWPTVYLIDKKGKVRWRWEGELEYDRSGGEAKMAALVEKLLMEEAN